MSILSNSLMTGEASGYQITRSLRFNSADSAYLSRTPGSAGNRKTWTWAGWVKRTNIGAAPVDHLMTVSDGSTDSDYLRLWFNGDLLTLGGYNTTYRRTTAVYRDVSAWYHIVCSVDTTQATGANRVRIYVNGSQVTSFGVSNDPTQNADLAFNRAAAHYIGREASADLDGYLADIHFIDGQALTPSSFGEFDSNNVWQPKAYSGSYGTNGFHLDFADNSNNTATTLGKDSSGNSNNWTPNNFSVTSGPVTSLRYATIASTYPAIPGTSNQTGLSFSNTWTVGTILGSSLGSRIIFDTGGNGNAVDITPQASSGNCAGSDDLINWTETQSTGAGTFSTKRYWWVDSNLSAYSGLKLESVTPNYAGNDSLVDSPTNYGTDTGAGGEVRGNYCAWNPLNSSGTLSNGNLDLLTAATNYGLTYGTTGVSSGKWYWEVTLTDTGTSEIGIIKAGASLSLAVGGYASGYSYQKSALKANNNSYVSYGSAYTTNDVIGVALDLDAGTLVFYKNGVSQGTAYSSLSGEFFPAVSDSSSGAGATATFSANFGQRPFAYTAPSGYKALCSTNLPAGTITTSGSFTGNATADGPFVYLNGVPTAMTINGNAVTFGTHADKLSNGFKLRTNSTSYNTSGSNTFSVSTTGDKFNVARAQSNP